MPTIVQTTQGRVTSLWGHALIRGTDGKMHALKVGDLVRRGDVILTSQDGIVQLAPDGPDAAAHTPHSDEIDRVITALNELDPLITPAAGLNGADDGELGPGLRVERINESISPASLLRGADDELTTPRIDSGAPERPRPEPINASSTDITAREEGPNVGLGLSPPVGLSATPIIVVSQVPGIGQIVKLDGSAVTVGMPLSGSDLVGLKYVPPSDYNGRDSIGQFVYTVTDGDRQGSGSVDIVVTPINDVPVPADDSASTPINSPIDVTVLGNDHDVDGDTLSVTSATLADPTRGSVAINPDGTLHFVPADNVTGPVAIGYSIPDGNGGTSSATLTVTVGGNHPPTGSDASRSLPEDGSYVVALSDFGYNDPDAGQSFAAVRIDQVPAAGSLLLNGTPVTPGTLIAAGEIAAGHLMFVPDGNANGTPYAASTFSVQDTFGAFDPAPNTLSFNVVPVNDVPSALPDSGSTAEDTPLSGNVLTNDSDIDGDTLSVTQFALGTTTYAAGTTAAITGVGNLTINPDGTYSFSPSSNYHGPVPTATYTVSDGVTTVTTSTLNLNVDPVNDAPTARDDLATTPINVPTTIAVLANDGDIDGDLLTVTGATLANPALGSVIVNADGTLGFSPADNVSGAVVINYTIADPSGATGAASVIVNVGANTPPAGTDATVTILEDTGRAFAPADFGFSDTDAGQTFASVRIEGLPGSGTLTFDGTAVVAGQVVPVGDLANLVFTPAPNASGTGYASLTFSVQDSSGAFDPTPNTITVNVTPITDGFVDADELVSVDEDAVLVGTVLNGTASVDGPVSIASFAIDGTTHAAGTTSVLAGVGSLTINADGSYVFTPAASYNGPFPVATYTVTDGVSTDTSTLAISVTPVTDGFTDTDEVVSVNEDTTLTGTVLAGTTSVDGALSITNFAINGTTYAAGATAVLAGIGSLTVASSGSYAFAPAANYNGPVPVATYTVTDGVSTDTSTLSIGVTPITDGFADADEVVAVNEDTTLNGTLLAGTSSVDGPITVTGFTVNGTAYAAGATTVLAGIGSLTIGSDGSYTFTPVANYNGPVPVATYTVTDGVSTDTSTLAISVTPIIDGFTDADEVVSVTEDTPLTGTVLGSTSSVDGPLSITSFTVSGTTHAAGAAAVLAGVGSLTISSDGSYTFAPAANYNGPVPVATYSVTDGISSDTSTLTINVTPVTDGFADADELVSVNEDTTLAGTVLAGTSSLDGSLSVAGFTVSGTTYAAGATAALGVGSLTVNTDGSYTFTPAANYNGPVPVATYTVTDGVSIDTSTLTIDVTPVTDGFSDADEVVSVIEDTVLTGTVLSGTTSVDGPVSITGFAIGGTPYAAGATAALAGVGSLTIDSDGSYTFAPAANYNGPVPVATYTVTDGVWTETSTLAISVTPVADSFADADEVASVNEDTTLSGTVLAGTSSVDGPVTITGFTVSGTSYAAGSAATLVGVGSLTINSDGSYTFTPATNYNGPVPVATYTVTDGVSTDTSTLSISVTPVTDGFSDADEVASVNEDTTLNGTVLAGTTSVDGPVSITNFTVGGTTYAAGASAALAGIGSLTIDSNGSYVFTPVANYNGSVPVATYTVTDGVSTDTSTLAINVTPTTDGFADVDEVVSVNEDTTLTGTVLGGTTSVDGPVSVANFTIGATTYAAGATAVLAGVGSLAIDSGGSYTFTPVVNYNGPVPVATYTVTDGVSIDASTLAISVTPVTDGFADADEVVSVTEDTTLTGNVLSGTTSVDGAVSITDFTIGGTTYAAGTTAALAGIGSLTVNTDGTYTFTPVANYNGPVPVATYTVTDGVSTDTSTLAISVTPIIDGFTDADEVVSVTEDTPLTGTVLGSTSSVDGPLSITSFTVSGTTHAAGATAVLAGVGSLTISSDGSYTFAPAANYNGPVPVATYSVTDGISSDTSTLTINVTPVTDGFADTDELVSVNEDTTLTGSVLAGTSSVDGPVSVTNFTIGGTTYSTGASAAVAGVGTLTINADGSYTFTPAANYNGPVPTATYAVTDGVSTDTSTLSIGVTPITDGFADADEVVSVDEDTTLNGTVLAGTSSVDGPVSVTNFTVGGTTYAAGASAALAGIGSLTVNADGSYVFTPVANYDGPVPVATYTVTDGVSTDTSTLTISVTPVIDGFTEADEVVSVNEDTTLNGTVLAGTTSVDGPVSVTGFTISGTSYAPGAAAALAGVGSLTINADGSYTFIPAANYNGPVPVATYSVTDGISSDTSTLTINVTPVADSFVDADETVSLDEDTVLTGSVLTGTSSVDGSVSVTQFVVGATTYAAGTTATIAGVGALMINADGSYTFTPATNYNGAVPVATYTVTDGVSTGTSTLTISVTPVTDGFTDTDEVVSVNEDTTLNGSVLAGTSSVDGPVSVTNFTIGGTPYSAGASAAIAGVGALTINADGSYTFTPAANYNGLVPVATYTVTDGVSTETSTLTISVTPVTDGFADADEVVSVDEDTTLNGAVLAGTTSVDGPVSITNFTVGGTTYAAGASAALAGVGSLTIDSNGSYSFTPVANYNGPVPVATYTVTDGVSTDTSTLSIGVTPITDGFADADEVVAVNEDTTLNGTLLAGTTSVDGPVSITNFTVGGTTYAAGATAVLAGVGSLTIDSNGSYVFNPVANYNGPVPVTTYTVTDGVSTDTSTLAISVTPVTDGFSDTDEVVSINEDVVLAGSVLAGTSSVDGPLSIAQFTIAGVPGTFTAGTTAAIAGVGSLVINIDGSYAFTPAPNYNGPVPVATYTVTDGTTTDTSTLTISVTPTTDGFADADEVVSVNEDALLTGTVLGGTTSVDGPLSITSFTVGGSTYSAGATAALAGVGSLTINSDGLYAFTPVANYNGPVPVATYAVTDGVSTHTSTLTISVTPVTDGFADADELVSVNEDTILTGTVLSGTTSVDGSVSITDFAVSGTSYAAGATAVLVGIGSLTINSDGSYTFAPAANYNGPVPAATYTVTDGTSTTTSTLSISVTPVPDGFADADEAGSVAEDSALAGSVLTGTSSFDGPLSVAQFVVGATTYAAGATATIVGVGSLTIAADGTYSFTPAANFNGPVPVVSYSVTDGVSTDTSTLSINVTPVADPAVISGVANGATVEDTTLVASGKLDVADPDAGEASFQPQTNFAGAHGTFSIDATGNWNYTLNNADPAVQALGTGQTLPSEVFTVRSIDGSTASVMVTITGTDDAPVISSGSGAVTENSAPSATGTLNATDVDNPTLAFVPATISGSYGSLTLLANGQWTYTLDARAEPLAQNQVVSEPITVQLTDGSTTTVTISVTGTNDAAVITGRASGTVTEDATLVASGSLAAADIDSPATFTPQSASLTYGDFSINAAGQWIYTLRNGDANVQALTSSQHPVETVLVATADGTTQQITITVNGANEAPSAIVTPASGAEDAAGIPIVLAGSDVDGSLASFTLTTLPLNGTLFYAGKPVTAGMVIPASANSASLSFVPNANWNGSTSLTFSTTDNEGASSASATQSITVAAVNDAPVASNDTFSTSEDTPITFGVLGNDSDVDGDALTITQIDGTAIAVGASVNVAGGSITLNANGTLTFTPSLNYNGSPSFTYTVLDGHGGTANATVNGTVAPINDAPLAVNDSATTPINTALANIVVLANDTDADGDALSVTGATLANPALGSVSVNPDGTLNFAPAPNVTGPVAINYTITDGQGGTSSAVLTVNVGANTPPSGANETVTIAEDTSKTFGAADFGFSDPDAGQALAAVRIDSLPGAGSLTLNGAAVAAGQLIAVANLGTLVFTPAANGNGNGYASFTFSVQDSAGSFDPVPNTITIDVTAVNDAPTQVVPAAQSTAEDTAHGIAGVTVADVDGGALTTTLTVTHGTLSVAASGATVATGPGSIAVTGTAAQINAALAGLSYAPAPDYNGADTLTVSTSDGIAPPVNSSVAITVTPVADIVADSVSTPEDTAIVFNPIAGSNGASADNFEGSPVLSAIGAASHGTTSFNAATGQITYSPAANYNGPDSFTYTVGSGGVTETATINVNVTAVNDPPTITGALTGTVKEDTTLVASQTLTVSDPDGPAESAFIAQSGVAGTYGTFGITSSGTWTYTLNNGSATVQQLGATASLTENFTIATVDGTQRTVTVTVNGTNDTPTAVNDSATVAENAALNIAAVGGVLSNDSDIDLGDTKSVSGVAFGATTGTIGSALAGTYGTLTLNADGSYSYAANQPAVEALAQGSSVTESFTYTMRDASGATSNATLTLTINGANDAPVANADSGVTTEDTTLTRTAANGALANDTDADAGTTLSVTQFTIAGSATVYTAGSTASIAGVGTLTLNADGGYTFAPAANYNGAVPLVTYTVSDGIASSSSTLNLSITPVNDAPINTIAALSTNEDTALKLSGLSIADVDAASGTMTVTLAVTSGTISAASSGGVTIAGSGGSSITLTGTLANINGYLANAASQPTFNPVADFNGSVSLTMTTNDNGNTGGAALSDVNTVAITVTPVADIVADSVSTPEDTAIVFNPITGSNGASADNFEGTPVLSAVGPASHGTTSFNAATGQITYTPAANYNGPDSFTYTVTSGGVTETATVSVSVTAVNDPPVNTMPGPQTTAEDTARVFSSGNGNQITVGDVDSASVTTTLSVLHGALTATAGGGATITANGSASVTIAGTVAQVNAALAGLQYAPVADYNGADTLTVQTNDSSLTSTNTVAITVTPVADIVADSLTTPEDTAITANLITGTNGASADNFESPGAQLTSVTQGANGTVTFAANGQVTYTPNANYNGTDSFTYTVNSGGVTETATVNVTVTAVNDPPVNTMPGPQTTAEDTTRVFSPSNGNRITVSDVDSASVTTTVSVLHGVLTATSAAGATITNNASGSVTIAGAAARVDAALAGLQYAPVADYNGSDTLTVQTNDGSVTSTNTVAITVTPVADIVADNLTTAEDTPITANVLTGTNGASADTFENPAAQLTSVTPAAHGSVTFNSSGLVTYTPSANYYGPDSFTYTVTSGSVTETATVNVTVTAVNDPPVANNDSATAVEAGGVNNATPGTNPSGNVITSNDTDPEGGVLKVVSVTGAASGTVNGSTAGAYGTLTLNQDGSYAYTLNNNFAPVQSLNTGGTLTDAFTYQVSDDQNAVSTATLNVTIEGADDNPVFDPSGLGVTNVVTWGGWQTTGGWSIQGPYVFDDAASNYTMTQTAMTQTGVSSLNFGPGAFGAARITLSPWWGNFGDPNGRPNDSANLTLSVGGVDYAVLRTPDGPGDLAYITYLNGATGSLSSVVRETRPLWTIDLPSNVAASGDVRFTANAGGDDIGLIDVGVWVYSASADTGPTYETTYLEAGAPVAVTHSTSSIGDVDNTTMSSAKIVLTDAQAGDVLSAGAMPAGIAASYNSATHTMTLTGVASVSSYLQALQAITFAAPSASGPGTDRHIEITVNDGQADSNVGTTTVHVSIDPPIAVADTAIAKEAGGVANGTAGIDPSGNVLTNDSDRESSQSALSVVSVASVPYSGALPVVGTVNGSTAGAYGTLTLAADGSYTYTVNNSNVTVQALNTGGTLTDTFTYQISDPQGATSVSTLTITVQGASDAPVAAADSNSVSENATLSVPAATGVLLNDTDVDAGDTKTVSTVGGSAANVGNALAGTYGTVTLNADGSYIYSANTAAADALKQGQTATDVFAYTMKDSGGLNSSSTLTITVNGLNDPPVLSLDADHSHNTVAVQSISGLFNTGQSNTGGTVNDFTQDLHYRLISQPAGGTTSAVVNSSPVWLPNDADSKWIGAGGSNQPTGRYSFQTSFTLQAGADPRSTHISFDVADDNTLVDILVNGVSANVSSQLGLGSFTHVELDGGAAFTSGTNTITFVVENNNYDGGSRAGPIGLRVDNMTGTVAVIAGSGTVHLGDYATDYIEGTPVSIADSDVLIQDVDSATMQSATITLTNAQTRDVLTVGALPAGVTASVNAAGTQVTLSGAASLASYQAAIKAIQFNNTTETPPTAVDRLVTVVVNDGQADSNTATTTIHVVSINDGPQAQADTAVAVEAGGVNNGTAGINPSGNVFTNDSDLDGSALTVTWVGGGPFGAGIIGVSTNGTYGTLVLNSDGSYQYTLNNNLAAVQALKAGDSLTDTFTYHVSDPQGATGVSTLTITVQGANDAPVNTVPGAQSTAEDTVRVFSSGNSNQITVGDVDSASVTTTLSVLHGALTATAGGGATITANGSASVTIAGTVAQVNAALAGLQYAPVPDYNGADSLSISTSDGVAAPVTSSVAITVSAVADTTADTAVTNEDTAVTINVLANDTFENPGRTITQVNGAAIIAGGAAVAVTNGSVGLDASGQLVFTPAANYSGAVSFNYTVTSGGVNETAGVNVTVNPVNDAPVINASIASVSEEGLTRGLADSTGSTDTTDARIVSGSMAVSDVDGSPTVTFAAPAPGLLTSGGQTVTWSGAGTNLLVGSTAAGEVLRIAIGNTGAYTVTLSRPIDHTVGGGENVRSLTFGVNASDGTTTSSNTLTVNIEDDSPVAAAINQTLPMAPEEPDVNLMIILDKSSSMDYTYSGSRTRMDYAHDAINALLDNYANYGGTVRVKVVSFGDVATEEGGNGSAWVDIATAKTLVNGIQPVAPANGTTWYDVGLAQAQTAFLSPGKIAGAATVSYFISDGDPTSGHEIDTEEAGWKTFLETNGIKSLAFGVIDTTESADLQSTSEVAAALNPVAYDGVTRTDLNATPISSFADMGDQLVPAPFGTAHGSVVAVPGTTVQGFGADGGYVQSLTIDGSTYTYNPAAGGSITVTGTNHGSFNASTDVLTITIASGANTGDKLLMNMDTGFYEYSIHAATASPVTQGFGYTLADLDGDTSSSTASITLSPLIALNEDAAAPVNGNVLSTTVDEQGDVLSVAGVVMNGVTFSPGTNVAGVYGTLVVNTDGTYSYTADSAQASVNGLFAGQRGNDVFTVHVSDGQGNITTSDLVVQVTGTQETFTTFTGSSSNNTITGTSGTDLLDGMGGKDTLNGGAGNDLLVGGQGSDTLTGGLGADVFQWRLNDNGTTSSPAADVITDFNTASRASGGDVIDLRDLLVGEYHVGTDAGNLSNYLHFEHNGNDTLIYVSTSGVFSGGFDAKSDNQNITLQNVNLVGTFTSDAQVIENLLKQGKLIADAG
jgi:VCBS repeat-containing protein